MAQLVLAIDQGTTGSTALVMDTSGRTLGRASLEFAQHYPQPGWVEHEPEDIWQSVVQAVAGALQSASVRGDQVGAIGITNQRETTLLWERAGGKPLHRAIVWQDRRTAEMCQQLRAEGFEKPLRQATGLVLDPYFSGTKLAWLLEHVDGVRARATVGDLCFGTVDSYLVYRLTGGEAHVTDVTNASRTMLMDLRQLQWHDGMCAKLGVPKAVLPKIVGSAEVVGLTRGVPHLPDGIPIAGIAGDQHAALFGQACLEVGDVKCTYGTGAFVLINTGAMPIPSHFGLLTTVAWRVGNETVYALEGSAFIAGAAVQWLRDGLQIIDSAPEIEALARQVPTSGGVAFVPALAGLGAPYWDPAARGLICGITGGTTRAHIARATLEAIAHEVTDLVSAMGEDLGYPIGRIRVDGGAAANDLLMQMQADYAGLTVERPRELETTARGAAMLASVGSGLVGSARQAAGMFELERSFEVTTSSEERNTARQAWLQAVQRARGT